MNVEQELRAILDKWKKDAPPIQPATRLDELEIDSVDLVEVMFEIEERFDIALPQDNDEARSASFEELCLLIERQMGARVAGAKR
jgi:acyl carrier protein